ncbi:hypothetical protein LH427_09620 [Laribacter hongkongensis]|uniref:hypothetical protein n=1 Tax=Laribacter hongkongensis TaxID=168471 RepID=UPI001EFD8C6B|nr:hypothetical protein [Laribacter hongkongensis]MCG8993230.1 hypothetical protein [Laribacter hongkongensis]MCG8997951.1 hypothetical protein [Laribacter hongkongensis]MCG9002338.1 hypothetical protein [Laribacter hongkongensis]MCG9005648.1 hypothetical protein [Laribacter hongkongensis]MCG9008785.1 hypothetical protein [Laribacter hongkongensis]
MSGDNTELTRALGRIEGKLDMIVASQSSLNERMDSMDGRLRHVEQQAAKAGAISGGIVAVGTALAVEMVKRALL